MAGAAARLIAVALAAATLGATAYDPVQALAGRYSERFRNGLVDGSRFWSEDVVEVAPVDGRHAYVRFALAFYNGHSCTLSGIAGTEGDALVYRAPPDDTFLDQPSCRLTIRRSGAKLIWDDDGTCKAHCGARGSFLNGELAWASRRPIRYLARLRRSQEFRDAMAEWQPQR